MKKELYQSAVASPDVEPEVSPDRTFLELSQSLQANVRFITDRYGVPLRMGRINKVDRARGITKIEKFGIVDTELAVKVLREELAKYPPDYLRRLHVRVARLIYSMSVADKTKASGENKLGGQAWQDLRAYIAFEDNIPYARGVIHHELVHVLRFRQRKQKKDSSRSRFKTMEEMWRELHSVPNPYLGDLYENAAETVGHHAPEPGFAKFYGRKNLEEDISTVGESLMADTSNAFQHVGNDDVFAQKLKRMMKYYERVSQGKMNRRFFYDLANGLVTEGYWS